MSNKFHKTAIVTGINGQDGFYLTKILINNGYRVVGVQRRSSVSTAWRFADLPNYHKLIECGQLVMESGDITDFSSMSSIINNYSPDEFYNLAAQSHVWHSFKSPLSTLEITGIGAAVCLDAIRQFAPKCKFYQAGSSEQFGNSAIMGKQKTEPGVAYERILDEDSPMIPRSPYGVAKLMAYTLVRNYREAYGMFAVAGVLFNHESEYRGQEFVTRKITDGIASILAGKSSYIELGNLDALRDWGHAEDYMYAAWLMLQQDEPYDYVISTGETHSIAEFLEKAFGYLGIQNWQDYVKINPEYVRPSEVDVLIGNSKRAHDNLGWYPSCDFDELVLRMLAKDCQRYGLTEIADQLLEKTSQLDS